MCSSRGRSWNSKDKNFILTCGSATNEQQEDAHLIVNGVFDKLKQLLALELNKFHQTSYSLRFWQITVGYWFRQYLDVFYDRYKILRKVRGPGRKFQVVTIKEHSEWIANDTDEYSVYLMSDFESSII